MFRTIEIALIALLSTVAMVLATSSFCPAAQPEFGPGSAIYAHDSVVHTQHGYGSKAYHLYEPDDPKIESAPMIVFFHGLFGTAPMVYGRWIKHIVRKGNIVVFPVYQSLFCGINDIVFSKNAVISIKNAINTSETKPDLDKIAFVGHSAGGFLSVNIAANATNYGIPTPKAIMCVAPGKSPMFRLRNLDQIDPDTLLLSLAGDRDMIVGRIDPKAIFNKTSQIANRNYILVNSDRGLSANHFAALTLCTDNIDYYAYWKLFDALCNAAFYNTDWEYCLGDTPEQRYMGVNRRGKPYKELTITLPDIITGYPTTDEDCGKCHKDAVRVGYSNSDECSKCHDKS